MKMTKYVIKRIILMFFVFFVVTTICFMLVRLLPRELPQDKTLAQAIADRWNALGYNEPLLTQFAIYLKNIFTKFDFGTSWYIQFREPALNLLLSRLAPTVLVNTYSLLFSIPIGIMLGIYAAIKKNKWQDSLISTSVMVFVSVPSYVYAFLIQYFLCFRLKLFPVVMDAGTDYFSLRMLRSMFPAVLSLSLSSIAGYARFTRGELTEVLTGEYLLLARAKGLTRRQITYRHALRNAMVPIVPSIVSEVIAVLAGSLIIESIFVVPGVGALYVNAITALDYNFFLLLSAFYTAIGLIAGLLVDLSYGFIDPRIRIGSKK